MNYKIFVEYDDARLSNLSNQIYNLFLENNFDVELLNNNISFNEKKNLIQNSLKKNFIISNKINNNDANSLEIIYPLRSSDEIAKTLENNLKNIITVSKYYQLRATTDTALDYYEILRNINNNDAIILRYGTNILNNSNLASFIYRSITNYLTNENVYTVKSGDSLYNIARRFNTTVDAIKKLNNLTTNNLSIGQKLLIPTTNNNQESPTPSQETNTYIVKSGDSLYSIARRFNTTVDAIKKLNNLTTNNLSLNQKLLLPKENNQESPTPSQENNTYIVKSGDSLYSIARRFNTTVDAIKKLNNLTTNNLSLNQKLLLPKENNQQVSTNTYTVKSGDSLYSIARRFNTTVDAIKKLNNLTTNNLSIGQKLLLPQ